MNRAILSLAASCAIIAGSAGTVIAADGLVQAPSLERALAQGKKLNRWVLLVIYDTKVPGQDCRASFQDPAVRNMMSGFVLTELPYESGYAKQLKQQYGLWSAGCLLLFRPNGALQAVDNGTPPPGADSMISHLQQMIQGQNLGGALRK